MAELRKALPEVVGEAPLSWTQAAYICALAFTVQQIEEMRNRKQRNSHLGTSLDRFLCFQCKDKLVRFRRYAQVQPTRLLLLVVLAWTAWLSTTSFVTFMERGRRTLNLVPIPRIQAGSLNVTEFFDKFHDTPVIIEGEVRRHGAFDMGWEGLKELCGDSPMVTQVYEKDSNEWAGLSKVKKLSLKDYIDTYILKHSQSLQAANELRYAPPKLPFSNPLPKLCPRLQFFTPVSKYFSNTLNTVLDFGILERTEGRKRLSVAEPELFIGAKNTKTDMHMDYLFAPFWYAVYIGKKKFRLISYEDGVTHLSLGNKRKNFMMSQEFESLRYQKMHHNRTSKMWRKKQLEIWNPDFDTFPALGRVPVLEGTVNAGDLIYVPSAMLHGVHSGEDSFSVTMQGLYPNTIQRYVDICAGSGFALDCKEVALAAVCDPGKIRSKRQFSECLLSSSRYKNVKKLHELENSREMHLSEMAGYKDYREWCHALCRSEESQLMREKLRASHEKDSPSKKSIALSEKMTRITCGQCESHGEVLS